MPRLPASAMALAIAASVTVSMLADTMGTSRKIFLENCDRSDTSLREKIADRRGSKSTSSNVYVSLIGFIFLYKQKRPARGHPSASKEYPLLSILLKYLKALWITNCDRRRGH